MTTCQTPWKWSDHYAEQVMLQLEKGRGSLMICLQHSGKQLFSFPSMGETFIHLPLVQRKPAWPPFHHSGRTIFSKIGKKVPNCTFSLHCGSTIKDTSSEPFVDIVGIYCTMIKYLWCLNWNKLIVIIRLCNQFFLPVIVLFGEQRVQNEIAGMHATSP